MPGIETHPPDDAVAVWAAADGRMMDDEQKAGPFPGPAFLRRDGSIELPI
jgi:hypothetical protein